MNTNQNKTLYRKLSKKQFIPNYAVEVGVYLPETSNIIDYIQMGIESALVEPDLKSIEAIKTYFTNHKNVTLYPIAVYDYDGKIELTQRQASTFVSALPNSPALSNDIHKKNSSDSFVADAKTFDQIDNGNIDLLSIDIEGGEWFVIKHMTSKPTVISLETHGGAYVNPYTSEILSWMNENGYRILYKDNTDSIFVNTSIEITRLDKLTLFLMNAYIYYQKQRKKLKIRFAK